MGHIECTARYKYLCTGYTEKSGSCTYWKHMTLQAAEQVPFSIIEQ